MTYPELAAIVGSTVPDYRGRFLRHVGGNSAALGVAQDDAIRNIYGILDSYGYPFEATKMSGPFKRTGEMGKVDKIDDNSTTLGLDQVEFSASHVVPTAAENRPVNIAVKWLIFAGN